MASQWCLDQLQFLLFFFFFSHSFLAQIFSTMEKTFAIITLFPLLPPQGINIFFPQSGGCSVQREALGHRNLKKSLLSAISDFQNLVWCVDAFTGMTKFTFGTRGLPINVRSIQLCCKTEIWGNPGYATCQKWSSDFFPQTYLFAVNKLFLTAFYFPEPWDRADTWHTDLAP